MTVPVPASFDEAFNDPAWYAELKKFNTDVQQTPENLGFVQAADEFASSPSLAQAIQIYSQYVSDTAPNQVNLPGATRGAIDAALLDTTGGRRQWRSEAELTGEEFSAARFEIYKLARANYKDFVNWAGQQGLTEPSWDESEGDDPSIQMTHRADVENAAADEWYADDSEVQYTHMAEVAGATPLQHETMSAEEWEAIEADWHGR